MHVRDSTRVIRNLLRSMEIAKRLNIHTRSLGFRWRERNARNLHYFMTLKLGYILDRYYRLLQYWTTVHCYYGTVSQISFLGSIYSIISNGWQMDGRDYCLEACESEKWNLWLIVTFSSWDQGALIRGQVYIKILNLGICDRYGMTELNYYYYSYQSWWTWRWQRPP